MKKITALFLAVLLLFALCSTALAETQTDEKEQDDSELSFSLLGLDGEFCTEELLSESKLTMVNFWEPWCGPCVMEMPELEELYRNYKDEGLNIIGVVGFCKLDFDEDGKLTAVDTDKSIGKVLETTGVTYPIYVNVFGELVEFQSSYVPTTVFLDSTGQLVGEQVIGARSYDDWAEIVDGLL